MKNKKKLLLFLGLTSLVVILTACGTTDVSVNSTGIWERYIVYNFARVIQFLSFGNPGVGIILFTLLVRIILFPLMNYQNKSMKKTQELQPKIKELQEQYSSKDPDTVRKLQEEQQRVYDEHGVNPFAGCLPLLVQMPILMAVWQAISRVPALTEGQFLWLELGKIDPTYILPVLAAILTFISTKLASMNQLEANPSMKVMNYMMPAMILLMGVRLASGLSLYWVISNAFQVVQTLIINNPFQARREREEEERKQKELERALRRAQSPKKKRNKR